MGQTAFWGFEMVPSWNLMSALMKDVTLSLKWLTVTLKIETGYRRGTNCFWGFQIVASWNLMSILFTDLDVSVK